MVGLASCAQGGVYVVELLDRYAASYSILFAVFCESIAVSWIYGYKRFSSDIKFMLGFEVGLWWKFCWTFCAPLFLMVIIVYGLISYEPLKYGDYEYPPWANILGLCIASSSVLCIPIGAIYQFYAAPGDTVISKLKFIVTPPEPLRRIALTSNLVVNDDTKVKDSTNV
jgi:solute carrier family 6 dopamine transporter-like protein 3